MAIGRKEAILALVATLIPWVGRRANAQVLLKDSRLQAPAPDIYDLQRRIIALETQLATQVGFTKDAYGNLKLRGDRLVTIESGQNLTLRASSQLDMASSGPTIIRGSSIALN